MSENPKLFQPVTFRSVTAKNRIVVAPMCQYSAEGGLGDDWHIQHLGARAMGGAGIVFTEATHVSDVGRITPRCLGLWNAEQAAHLKRLAAIITRGDAVPGIQIAHAGRKGSAAPPWEGSKGLTPDQGGWTPVAPSAVAFSNAYIQPAELSLDGIGEIVRQFAATARMSLEAGFKVAEIHGAHGYLVNQFLSPLSNHRSDAYGGDLSGRMRLLMEILDATRAVWPAELPLFVRLSCTEWTPGGLTIEDMVEVCRRLAARGDVDLIDCSSGGNSPAQKIPSLHPGYQVPLAEQIRHGAGIATGAVGLIRDPEHAAEIVANDRADLVFLARVLLADPAWPLRAAQALGAKVTWPLQYQRGSLN